MLQQVLIQLVLRPVSRIGLPRAPPRSAYHIEDVPNSLRRRVWPSGFSHNPHEMLIQALGWQARCLSPQAAIEPSANDQKIASPRIQCNAATSCLNEREERWLSIFSRKDFFKHALEAVEGPPSAPLDPEVSEVLLGPQSSAGTPSWTGPRPGANMKKWTQLSHTPHSH